MGFVKKTWKDRLTEFPGRRRLKDILTGVETVVDVTRNEGEEYETGDAFNKANMEDLEQRIEDAIGTGNLPEELGNDIVSAITQLNSDNGGLKLSYEDGNYYAQYGEDASSKKILGEINKIELINALANSGLGLTHSSTPAQIYAALATKFPPTKSWIVSGWSVSPSGYATMVSNNGYVQMTMGNVIGTANGTSPIIDITPFKTLTLYGESKRYSRNVADAYFPKIYLVNKNTGSKTLLFSNNISAAAGTGTPGAKNINLTYNTANLSGDYYLEFDIYSHETAVINSSGNPNGGNNGNSNYGSYIKLTKALLSA